jgi:ubiquinone/menaquinone biosynthesis C-methylase UbiE
MTATDTSYFYCENPVVDQVSFQDRDVLEVGCGDGRFTFEYLTDARSVLGIDPDAEAIEELKSQWSSEFPKTAAEFRHAKIEDLTLPEASFDCVVFTRSF